MPGFSDHYPAQSNHDVLKLINLHSLIFKGAIVSVQAVNEMKRLAVASGCVYCMKWKVSRCCAAQYSPGHKLLGRAGMEVRNHRVQPRAILSPPSPITSPYKHSYTTQHTYQPLPASLAPSPHMVRCLDSRVPPPRHT